MTRYTSNIILAIGGIIVCSFSTSFLFADVVTPSDRVVNFVNIREAPSTNSEIIGELRPGVPVEFVALVGKWYKIKTENEDVGFVSRNWTVRIAAVAAAPDFKCIFSMLVREILSLSILAIRR